MIFVFLNRLAVVVGGHHFSALGDRSCRQGQLLLSGMRCLLVDEQIRKSAAQFLLRRLGAIVLLIGRLLLIQLVLLSQLGLIRQR